MDSLQALLARAQGRDPEAEEKLKKSSQAGIDKSEQETGKKFQEEPGIEHDPYSEAAATMAAGPLASGLKAAGRSALEFGAGAMADPAVAEGGYIGQKAAGGLVGKLKDAGPPAFHQGVEAGETGTGASNFSKWVKPAESDTPTLASKTVEEVAPKESLTTPRFNKGIDPKVSSLHAERDTLNLRTPEGRARLKEIDDLLSNRTYFEK